MTSYLLSSSRSNAAAIRPGASLSRHNTTREICGAVFRYCERGGGKPRPFSVEIPLSDSVVCYGTSPYSTELADETFRLARIAFNAGLDLRREGSAELDLCSVAAGRAGLYFEMQVSLWDYAAGALLVREAGGVCQDIRGAELPFDGSKPTILAGGSHAVMDFLKLTEGGK